LEGFIWGIGYNDQPLNAAKAESLKSANNAGFVAI